MNKKSKNKIKKNKKKEKTLINSNNSSEINLSYSDKRKLIKYKSLKMILIILIIFIIILILYILILSKKYRELSLTNNFNELFRSDLDLKLFRKNKTQFFYKERKKFLPYVYNESYLRTFQDKLNYLIIHESPEYKSNFADKIKLNEISKKIFGKDICVPILKVYDDVDEINLDELPEKFALKCNHGSGMNIFCKDKSKFNLEEAKKQLNEWKNTNYGFLKKEFQYIFIKRKIFASPYLGDNLIDYKIFCFNGQPKFIATRIILNIKRWRFIYNYYDLNWNLTEIELHPIHYKRSPNVKIEKPKHLDLMIDYAKKLSKDFVFVRVDFYDLNDTLYLGELTFTPSNILMPFKNEAQRLYLGSLLDITKIKPSLFNN